jgi:hypothetical protein
MFEERVCDKLRARDEHNARIEQDIEPAFDRAGGMPDPMMTAATRTGRNRSNTPPPPSSMLRRTASNWSA